MTRVQTLSLAIGVALAALAVGWMAGRHERFPDRGHVG